MISFQKHNIAMGDYQETPDKVIPMCRYASQAIQNASIASFYVLSQVQNSTRYLNRNIKMQQFKDGLQYLL